MLKLLQYIDQLPLEKPEGTKVFNVVYLFYLSLVQTVQTVRNL